MKLYMRWFVCATVATAAAMVLFLDQVVLAQLNCNQQKCVEIKPDYHKEGPHKGKNKRCYIFAVSQGNQLAYAYSLTYAEVMYGKDSKGGKDGDEVSGYYFPCTGKSDCALVQYDVSGDVVEYTGTLVNTKWNSKCKSDSSSAPPPGP